MRRLALLLAAGSLWLFLAAIPALADGGPHVATTNSGVTSLTADSCAGCHRAHTAQGQYLLVGADTEEELCLTCHGATSTGAATDVVTGVQYIKNPASAGTWAASTAYVKGNQVQSGGRAYSVITAGTSGTATPSWSSTTGNTVSDGSVTWIDRGLVGAARTTVLGYLRDGGFEKAHIGSDNGVRVTYYRSATDKSNRPKIPADPTAENVTSAHLAGIGASTVVAKDKIWGNGVANAAAPTVEMECGGCHNVHGNGQYRILQKFNASDQLVQEQSIDVTSASIVTDRFLTVQPHNFIVGDLVQFSGLTGIASTPAFNPAAVYIVKTVPSATQFTVALAPNKKTSDIGQSALDITTAPTATGTVVRYASIVDDAALPVAGDTRNYTILQTKGTQTNPATYMLYESNVLAARATGSFNGIAGDYGPTGGDYFHRTVPWNPALTTGDATCNTNKPADIAATTDCSTSQDAPNGRPATTSSQITFNEQMSAWCATCHTRYWGGNNPPPTDTSKPSSAQTAKNVTAASASGDFVTVTGHGYSVGDRVQFSGASLPGGLNTTTVYKVLVVVDANNFAVSATLDGPIVDISADGTGTVIRTATVNASPWWYARPGESGANSYKYQHSTSSNRACTVCHVGHGSDAVNTPGGLSDGVAYPDGDGTTTAATAGLNSRLLKVDNRGTCQMCHDPTNTVDAGSYVPTGAAPGTFPVTVP